MKRNALSCVLLLVTISLPRAGQSVEYADIISASVICKQPGKYIGWPSIAKTRSGGLPVVFSAMRDAHVCPYGITQMIRSNDNGKPSLLSTHWRLEESGFPPAGGGEVLNLGSRLE